MCWRFKKRDPTPSDCINDSMDTNEKVDETPSNNQSDINVVQNDSTADGIGTPEETKEGGTTNEVVVESVGNPSPLTRKKSSRSKPPVRSSPRIAKTHYSSKRKLYEPSNNNKKSRSKSSKTKKNEIHNLNQSLHQLYLH